MKKLKSQDLELICGGSAKSVVADIGCMGVGLSFGLINPLLGAVMGIGCGLLSRYYT
jgi:hypothetical protein